MKQEKLSLNSMDPMNQLIECCTRVEHIQFLSSMMLQSVYANDYSDLNLVQYALMSLDYSSEVLKGLEEIEDALLVTCSHK